ncbi:Forkhead box protein O4 [Manis javanica]|nr:Forkhead box protein O4 [Manis javanica]
MSAGRRGAAGYWTRAQSTDLGLEAAPVAAELWWRVQSGPRFRGEGDSDGSAGRKVFVGEAKCVCVQNTCLFRQLSKQGPTSPGTLRPLLHAGLSSQQQLTSLQSQRPPTPLLSTKAQPLDRSLPLSCPCPPLPPTDTCPRRRPPPPPSSAFSR